MYAEITAAIQSVKTVADLAKAANSLSNYNELITAVSEVNAKLMDATAVALQSQERQSAYLSKIAELEKEIETLKAKQVRSERYALHRFPTAALAYKLKEVVDGEEPMHFLCAKCVDSGGHTKLQPSGNRRLKCFSCETTIQIEFDPPSQPRQLMARSSYLGG